MPEPQKKAERPRTPSRQTRTAHEPKPQRGAKPPKIAKPPQASATRGLTEPQLIRLAFDFFAYHEWMIYLAQSVDGPSPLRARFDEHLKGTASELPVLTETFESYDHVNVQRAIDLFLARPSRKHELVGVEGGRNMSLADLIASKQRSGLHSGPVERVNLPSGPESVEECVQVGLYFIAQGRKRSILFVRGPDLSCGRSDCIVEVVSTDAETARALLGEIRGSMAQNNVFRGHVISFADTNIGRFGLGPMIFWNRPDITSEELVLPEGVLEVIERQVLEIASHRDQLLATGQHLKRGLLLHGPPGTGKTHTVRYLLGRAGDHTVVVLTGGAMRFVRQACALARLLQPAVVVLEDVDLVAKQRDHESGNPLLFDVLNSLDGISDDADIVFVLTTNRADLLEPALAARPGRVDLAVEIPLPGAEERLRLLRLYGRKMKMHANTEEEVVSRTEGVTASFLRELVRKAALLAAMESSSNGKIQLKDSHLLKALEELLTERSALTRALLGQGVVQDKIQATVPGWL